MSKNPPLNLKAGNPFGIPGKPAPSAKVGPPDEFYAQPVNVTNELWLYWYLVSRVEQFQLRFPGVPIPLEPFGPTVISHMETLVNLMGSHPSAMDFAAWRIFVLTDMPPSGHGLRFPANPDLPNAGLTWSLWKAGSAVPAIARKDRPTFHEVDQCALAMPRKFSSVTPQRARYMALCSTQKSLHQFMAREAN